MKPGIYILIILFFISSIYVFSSREQVYSHSKLLESSLDYIMPKDSYDFQYLVRRDTIFVLSDSYIEICLKTQYATLNRRNDTPLVFGISSGTDLIDKGMLTTSGIYSVQSKLRVGISKQFNDAELINWIGFNGNIGFHGLRTSGYYNHLGKRPSSHGCVRISREDGDTLYKYVRVGTPVIVYHDQPARILSFINDSLHYGNLIAINDNSKLKKYLNSRIDNLYNGYANYDFNDKLFIPEKTVFRKLKINIGNVDKISAKQKYIGRLKSFAKSHLDNTLFVRYYTHVVEQNETGKNSNP